jgi:hypothetical protein
MNYQKPEIVRSESAIAAIQSTQQKQIDRVDSTKATDPAYEADE